MSSNYPPGVGANTYGAPWNEQEGPCDVCGQPVDECVCPECPACGAQGDPRCYEPRRPGVLETVWIAHNRGVRARLDNLGASDNPYLGGFRYLADTWWAGVSAREPYRCGGHGLTRSLGQVALRAAYLQLLEDERNADDKYRAMIDTVDGGEYR